MWHLVARGLTAEELETIKSGGHKAALLWAGAGTWYNALSSGAKDAFAELEKGRARGKIVVTIG